MASLSLLGVAALSVAAVCATSGCSTISYYAQSVEGHLDLLRSARPVPQWLNDDAAPPTLKERLALTQKIRDYAVHELHLPDNSSYRRYADIKRSAAVWNVVAAPELSLTLKTWCFAIVGCVGYRGYFDRASADAFATEQRAEGLEAAVYGVTAYSTLGALPGDFFADPILSTFIGFPEGELARLIFHELAHQVAYAKGDTMFNESFATAVERIGGSRWLSERATQEARDEYRQYESRRTQFRAMVERYGDRLEAIYNGPDPDERKRQKKAELMAEMRAEYQRVKTTEWGGFSGYDAWFARANNAAFGVLAAYTDLVPVFESLFEREGHDFDRFYAEAKRLAALPSDVRRAALGVPPAPVAKRDPDDRSQASATAPRR